MKWVPVVTREQHDGRLFSFIIFSLTNDTQEKNLRFLDMRLGAKSELVHICPSLPSCIVRSQGWKSGEPDPPTPPV